MSDGIMKNWNEYKPTKTLWFWSCVGAAALTIIVGFSAGGWMTGGTAADRVQASTEQAVAQLAAGVCVNRFLAATDAGAKLVALKKIDSWKQDTFIEDGGWATFANAKEPIEGAAQLCAKQLVTAKPPAANTMVPTAAGA